jgi:hypothetical protein
MTTTPKERPILFSGPMVRAILDGRKTQTRRVVKSLLGIGKIHAFDKCETFGWDYTFCDKRDRWNDLSLSQLIERCRHGKPGDRLWVREAFRLPVVFDGESPQTVGKKCVESGYRKPWAPIRYEAGGGDRLLEMLCDFGGKWGKNRVSIHMPRWASRITLEITSVRVERLDDISEADAIAEGVSNDMPIVWESGDDTPRGLFGELWESINGEGSWDLNPWVWVIEFQKAEVAK